MGVAVGAVIDRGDAMQADRRCAIALALVAREAAAPDRAGVEPSLMQEAARRKPDHRICPDFAALVAR